VVLVEGVHGASRVVRYSEDYSIHALYGRPRDIKGEALG
jgi:hypothetical protein